MANKIYDFLPGHLKNKELETIFDATLERVFSKGSNEKIKAYVGRTERGIYNSKDIYIDYPSYAYARKNYAFEPVFENKISGDRVFYDDFLNSLFNKGSITTDHHRLLRTEYKTINLPIDADKFVNYSLYYWVYPGFFADDRTVSDHKHYVTIDKGVNNWWSNNNAWYHYDDIRDEITPDNSDLIVQAKRPIIEFDNRLELSDASNNKSNNSVEEPTFNLYDSENDIISHSKLFNYVTGDYAFDQELIMRPKMKAGDYASEFVFEISFDETEFYKLGTEFVGVYIEGEFKYRNFRDSVEEFNGDRIELSQEPIINTLEVYIDGIKTKDWTYSDNTINLNDSAEAALVYVDYKTLNDVNTDGNNSYQKIIPEIEYNVDNKDYYDIELDYSTIYQHFHRIIDTTENLEGDANASNNFRQIGDNTDKLRFNTQGSVLVKRDVDIKDTYFSVTNDVYDPYAALEFISSAYNSYKNRVIGIVEEMLNEPGSETKSNTQLLEEALATITRTKSAAISMFVGVDMISMGSRYSHYHQGEFTIAPGSDEQIVPSLDYPIVNDENVALYFNGELLRLNVDYTISQSGNTVTFIGIIPQADDSIVIRNYTLSEDSYMPPSAVKLGISSSHRPRIITDENYGEPIDFILGHDGSKTPLWGNRIDDVLLELENRIWNKLDNTVKTYSWCDAMSYLNYADADPSYSFDEKNYTLYPFFKKWMIRNNIDNIHNDAYSVEDWKTWNYKSMNATTPGHWRGMIEYYYGTDQLFSEPWKMLFESKKPENFDNDFGTDYRSVSFWENLIAASGLQVEVPVDANGNLKSIDELFFNNSMTQQDIDNAKADWEFGDGSPVEMAWRRSSEYPFIAFLGMLLLRPVEVNTKYRDSIDTIVGYFLDKDDISVENVTRERDNYEFNLGSKLAGFVNNVKIYTENSGLANSRFTEIPKDNYNLFVHKGEPNRSEFFSAVIFEKVSLDTQYPKYDIADTANYRKGDIVYNELDKKYYKRKVETQTDREQQQTINFDYDGWVLISQPKTRKFGYRIHGYDDFNPTFYTLDWDKTSGKKAYSTKGDERQLNDWRENTYYRMDEYVTFNGQPYVCLNNHTSSTIFDNNLEDWKQLKEAPRTNVITANGYNSTTQDKVKTYNYGDILESIDDVAQMMIGYQDLLALLGWEFTDIDNETNEVVDFESLLYKFLDWTAEKRDVGEFITLSPILFSGAFSAPYGVASVKKETYKNFYRVVDSSGRLINDNQITFYTNGDKITWESEVPVYGMKIDISDVEHAITFDRVDSYSDVIYDPHFNNRNLRFTLDCNRTSNWDGTLQAEGYIVYGDQMIPNFDTLVEDTRYYRDTMVDQNLEIINRIKARQIGFTQRDYLDNFEVERESQLEFYKGFIAAKGSQQSISSILNNNSNYTDIAKSDVWKIFENDFGVLETIRHAKATLAVNDIKDDPYNVNFTLPIDLRMQSYDDNGSDILFKNSGYVDSKLVNYVVSGENDLMNFIGDSIYEGDLAWIQFDPDRDWDVRRLSEISEINYVGETSDGQLYVVLAAAIDTTDPVFLKIQSDDIDPKINGYYYLILDETLQENGLTVYKYLAFEQSFEPLSVEIDSETSNSVFVPTSDSTTIEAISNISNPELENGDVIVVNGTTVTYDETALGSSGILITGSNALPFVQDGEEIRVIVYDGSGNAINTTTDLEFDSFGVQTTGTFAANVGDQINIDGTTVEVQASGTNSISVTSNATDETPLITGETVIVDANTFTVKDISIVGSVAGVTITTTRPLTINGYQINFTPDTYPSVPNETATVAAPTSSYTVSSVTPNQYTPTSVQVDNGVDPVYTLTSSQFTYNSSTGVITFNTAIQDGVTDHDGDPLTPDQGDGTVDLTIVLSPNAVPYTMQDMVDEINLATAVTQVSAIINGSGFMSLSSSLPKVELTGSIIQTLGIHTSDTFSKSKLEQLIDDMQALGSSYTVGFTPNLEMQLQTTNPTMNLSGTALNDLGISAGDYFASSDPTLNSVASQIIAAGITGVSAEVIGSTALKITKNGQTLQVSEVTSGAMSRLGFASTVYNLKSVDYIVERINTVLFANNAQIATASVQNDVVVISSNQSAMTISNISGNALSDIGITPTTYISEFGSDIDAAKLRDQINVAQQEVTVSLTSDSRLVFVTEKNSIDFTGTSQAVLDKLGLYQIYTTASSNPNFKVMRWKSVRYTPGVNGDTFSEFFSNLGLNDISYIWADDYNDSGWHVLFLNSLGVVNVHAKSTSIIDTNKVRKLLIKDDNNQFYNYHPYDPLLGIIPGDIRAKLDYITWKDPAKYDYASDKDIWLDERVDEVWWDTTHTRFYRYNDYGNELGIKDISYVKRYWGRIIPGSEVVLKKWTKSNTLPDNVSNYNSYTYYDVETKKTITNYYYWDEKTTVSGDNSNFDIGELKKLVESDRLVNKFLPIDAQTVIVSDRKQNFIGETIELDLQYVTSDSRQEITELHKEWAAFSEHFDDYFSGSVYDTVKDSIVNRNIKNIETFAVDDLDYNLDANYVIYGSQEFVGLSVNDIVVSSNSNFINSDRLSFDGVQLKIRKDDDIIIGDVVRVYVLSNKENNIFNNTTQARENFAALLNKTFDNIMIDGVIPEWKKYVSPKFSVVLDSWSLTPEYKEITKYEYLSRTRDFDMIALYNDGIGSFKVELEKDEYYFDVDGDLRLVNLSDSTLQFNFNNIFDLVFDNDYLSKCVDVQIYELFNMFDHYMNTDFKRQIVRVMINYLFSEIGEHTMDVFKTSEIDIKLKHKPLQQYSTYQRDSIQDILDYINETKPYHTKIRKVYVNHNTSDDILADVDDYNEKHIDLKFGTVEEMSYPIADMINRTVPDILSPFNPNAIAENIDVYADGVKVDKQYWYIDENGNLIIGADDAIFKLSDYTQLTVARRISRYDYDIVDGLSDNGSLETDAIAAEMLDIKSKITDEPGGVDTGFVPTRMLESTVFKIETYEDETQTGTPETVFTVYDQFGRVWELMSENETTISSITDNQIYVNDGSYFADAKSDSVNMIALETGSTVEFITYNDKDGVKLEIDNRRLFNGLAHDWSVGDKIHSLRLVRNQ